MTGLLASRGLRASEVRVGQSLSIVNPGYHHARKTSTARQINPAMYHADYFGHKLHIDQNEKLVMYGVTHICAIDGFSGKIVGLVTMPVKNNLEIYEHLFRLEVDRRRPHVHAHSATYIESSTVKCIFYIFRNILVDYGLWDQVRVDQGKEWILMLFVQEHLAHLRYNQTRHPHLQSTSKQVCVIVLSFCHAICSVIAEPLH